jgi:cytochrome c553
MNGEHGKDCPKVKHYGNVYLHAANDDSPYDVDGIIYCGRCHGWMGIAVNAVRRPRIKPICAGCGFAHPRSYADCVFNKDI